MPWSWLRRMKCHDQDSGEWNAMIKIQGNEIPWSRIRRKCHDEDSGEWNAMIKIKEKEMPWSRFRGMKCHDHD